MNRSNIAFTLIELLVVIAILAILAGLLMPSLRASRERGAMTSCASRLRQIHLALEMYADDNGEDYPRAIGTGIWGSTNDAEIGWMQRIMPYSKSAQIYRCPRQPVSLDNDYSYFFGSRAAYIATGHFAAYNRKQLRRPSEYILSGDSLYGNFDKTDTDKDNYSQDCLFTLPYARARIREYHAGKVNLLFADGHVRAYDSFVPPEMTYSYDDPGIDWDQF